MALPVLHLGAEAPTEDTDQGEVTSSGTATTVLRLGPSTDLTDPDFLHRGQRAYLGMALRRVRPRPAGPIHYDDSRVFRSPVSECDLAGSSDFSTERHDLGPGETHRFDFTTRAR